VLRCPSVKEKVFQITDITSSVVLDSHSHPIILSTSLPEGVLGCLFSHTIDNSHTRTNFTNNTIDEYAGTLARIVLGGEWMTHSRLLQKALRKKFEQSDGEDDRTQFWSCNDSSCSIPYLPSDLNEGRRNVQDTSSEKYYLISISYNLGDSLSLDKKEIIKKHASRFFDRSTFGPTRQSLQIFISKYTKGVSDVNSLNDAYAAWTADQMETKVTPLTSHRAYFRRRADKYMLNMVAEMRKEKSTRPIHPCEPFSRWRNFTFTEVRTSTTR